MTPHTRHAILALIVALGSLLMTRPAAADTDEAKLAVAREMLQAWHDRDWERVYALFAPQGVLHSMMIEPVVGREAIRARLGLLAPGIERIDLKVRHMGVIDGRVFIERVDDFTYKGHDGQVPVVGVLEIEGGLVTAWREYYDHAQLRAAMGVAQAGAAH